MTFTRPTHNYSNNVADSRLDWQRGSVATGQLSLSSLSVADDISEVSGDNLTRRCREAAATRLPCCIYARKGFAFRVPPHATEQQQSSNNNNSKSTGSSCYKAHSSRNEATATRTTTTATLTVATRACVGHHFVCF